MTTHYDDLLPFPFSSKITVEKTIFNLSKTDKGGVIKSAHLSLGNKISLFVLNAYPVESDLLVSTVSIHCAPEMSEIDCIGRIESFWLKFVRGGKYFGMFSYS